MKQKEAKKEIKKEIKKEDVKAVKGTVISLEKDFNKVKRYGKECLFNKPYNIELWEVGDNIRLMSHYALSIPADKLIKAITSKAAKESRPFRYTCKASLGKVTIIA